MFLILPDSLNPGIQSMEANLTTDTIKAQMTTLQVMHFKFLFIFSLQDEVVNVKVPRFQIEATRNIDEEIRSLGVEAIFTPGVADFTNMVRRNLIPVPPQVYNRGSEETRAQTVPASWTWIEFVSTSSEHAAAVSTIFGYSAKLLPLIRKLTGRSDVIIVATTSFSDINFSSLMLTGVTGCGFP